ncbi:UNVERIFIED_ORG: hypothetical protein ABIC48_000487 [Burkholderia territorii]
MYIVAVHRSADDIARLRLHVTARALPTCRSAVLAVKRQAPLQEPQNVPSPLMSDTEAVFQITADDLVHAYRLHLWRRYNAKYLLKSFAIVTIVYVVLLVGGLRLASGHFPEWRYVWMAAGIAAVVAIGVPVLNHLILPRAGRKIYDQQRTLHQVHTVIFQRDRFIVETPTSRDDIHYADLIHWSEDRQMILLYQSSVMFRVVPKRVLDDGQVAFLHRVLLQNGVRKV